ncbi:MAG TPA: RHS repeat-associated core domain-containing protein, partial [Edaphobacter sp.]
SSAATIAVAAATNHLASDTYDHGNDISFGTTTPQTTVVYDSLNMPVQTDGASGTAYFLYTADDERIGVLTGDTWNWSLRGVDHEVLRQFRSSNSVPTSPWIWVEDYVYRGGQLLAAERVAEEGGRRHFHLDHLGTPRLITGSDAVAVSQHDYTPFGLEYTVQNQELQAGFDREEPTRFTGHERDYLGYSDYSAAPDYMHARAYAAELGRFLSLDPTINFKATSHNTGKWHRYSYVLNNPVLYHDPSGKQEAVGFALDRDVQDLLAHRITEQEYWARLNARGTGAGIGAGIWASWWAGPGILEFLGDAASSIAARLGFGPGAEIARRIFSDPNRLNHIFGDEGHRLSELTERLGGEANVVTAVADRVGAIGATNLPTNANGVFNTFLMVGGEVVQVTGRVIDGVIYISNFWVPRT